MSTRPIAFLFQSRMREPGDPPYDPSQPIKAWADPNPAGDPVTYTVFDGSAVKQVTMSRTQAMAVNFPGHDKYPAYVETPAAATFNGKPFPLGVVSRADAEKMADVLKVPPDAIVDAMNGFANTFPIEYGTETRRAWAIVFKGTSVLVADLIAQMDGNGVGAPGEWDLSGQTPVWVSHIAPTVAAPDATILPVPIVPLGPGETIIPPNIGMGAMIETADAPAPVAGGGGLLPDERAALLNIYAGLKKIYGAMIP